jgi:hypothetical protein
LSTATISPDPPPLRRQPVPVTQPRPALRVVQKEDDTGTGPAVQAALLLPPDALPTAATTEPTLTTTALATLAPTGTAVAPVDSTAAPADGATGNGKKEANELVNPQRAPDRPLPEPGLWAAQFVQAAVEVTMGLRPSNQLVRWADDEVRGLLTRRASLTGSQMSRGRACRREVVRSTRVSMPRAGVAEATVVLSDGTRARAVALRLEGLDGRWRVTALQLG